MNKIEESSPIDVESTADELVDQKYLRELLYDEFRQEIYDEQIEDELEDIYNDLSLSNIERPNQWD